jgi:hypothetical protein
MPRGGVVVQLTGILNCAGAAAAPVWTRSHVQSAVTVFLLLCLSDFVAEAGPALTDIVGDRWSVGNVR